MTATKKLFIAAVLIAVGFGVARLMGRPDAPWLVPHAGDNPVADRNGDKIAKPIAGTTPAATVTNGARLVPDFSADNPYRVRTDESAPPQVQSSLSEVTVNSVSAVPMPLATSNNDQPQRQFFEPRVKLRDEAPRPLDFDSRGQAAVYTQPAPPSPAGYVSPDANTRSAAADWRASGLTPAEFVQNSTSTATINASYSQPSEISASASTVAPPPWSEPAEASGPRTHVVVDGDSLERLAGRYLDDSSRSNEIYEANRELLASPDLLPIGAALVIPKQDSRAAFDASKPQSSLAKDPSLRSATHGDMVRVRPIPSSVNVVPRAQLLPPVQAD